MLRRAVFFDRDGTLCENNDPVVDPRRLRLLPRAAEAVRRLNRGGWQVVVVTEQPGVAFGEFDEDVLAEIHEQMRLLLLEDGARLDGIYHCPHHPEARLQRYRHRCACRKPGVALFERARDEMGIDLDASFLFSDNVRVLQAAATCGIRPVLVRTGGGRDDEERLTQLGPGTVPVVDAIDDAVGLALRQPLVTGATVS